MTTHIEQLTNKYRSKGVLLDSNLLLLLFVGSCDVHWITTFKRTSTFTIDDYKLLLRYVDQFQRRVTTPNVMTEISNLANSLTSRSKATFADVFRRGLALFEEQYVSSASASTHDAFQKYGLTDAAIITYAKDSFLLLTVDFPLAQYFESKGGDVVNFNHMRQAGWT